jgi:acyl carrier protein
MGAMSEDLKFELKKLIVDTLNLEDVDPTQIKDEEPIFGSSLDLDSIDGLELVLQLEKTYGIKIGSSEESRNALQSINVLADFIARHRQTQS